MTRLNRGRYLNGRGVHDFEDRLFDIGNADDASSLRFK